ncbi:MAG: PAS domain-containing sensor histidine kinase [Deltaproteobacteria bacterium]|nr:PAS domain-containing sensor histidine kinase [Deltaproteobacteria bacterium]
MGLAYEACFDAVPGYLTVQDRDLTILDANTRFKKDFGDPDGRFCYQIYKHRSEKCEMCPVEKTFRDGATHTSLEQIRSLDGRDIPVLVNTSPIRNESGELVAVMEMSTDITDLKLMEDQLRESQHRYRALFEEVPCYISIQDHDLRIVEVNRRFREDFGEGSLGCRCYQAYKHRDETCVNCPVLLTFEDGQVHRSEEVVTSLSGEQQNVLVYTAPIRGPEGRIQHVMEMSTNITPIRQLQSQLESVGILISSISHGLKGLLNGLDGGIYLVNSGLNKDDRVRLNKGWEMVQRNVERIRSQVLNILYYAKERIPNWDVASAGELAEEVKEILGPKAAQQRIRFEVKVDPDVGDFDVDRNALRAMLVNLLENSLDACRVDPKDKDHQVVFGVEGRPDHVRFVIDDNGIGMDRETREKAFSLFYSSKGMEGTGLGLFVANNIAQAHGGHIHLESEPGVGTRFIVDIPRERSPKIQEEGPRAMP